MISDIHVHVLANLINPCCPCFYILINSEILTYLNFFIAFEASVHFGM